MSVGQNLKHQGTAQCSPCFPLARIQFGSADFDHHAHLEAKKNPFKGPVRPEATGSGDLRLVPGLHLHEHRVGPQGLRGLRGPTGFRASPLPIFVAVRVFPVKALLVVIPSLRRR